MAKSVRSSGTHQKKHPVEKADLKLAQSAADWRHHPVIRALGGLSELADQPPLYTICVATVVIGAVRGDARLARTGLRMLAAEWLATKAKGIVKHRIDRSRPQVPVGGGKYRRRWGESEDPALNSFPSGHTAGAVAVAKAFASEYPEHSAAAATLAVAVGAIQIPRCKHYLTDVAAGALIGFGAGSLVAKR